MTVSADNYAPKIYTGNGVTDTFSTVWTFDSEDDIVVTERVIATGAETTKTITTHYTVTGGAGLVGSVVAVTPPASTVQWVLTRATTKTQDADYTANDPFPAETHEDALDKDMRLLQEIAYDAVRSLRFPKTDSTSLDATLPSSITRASKLLVFDSSGNPTAVAAADYDLTTVTAFIATLLDDTTAAAARTTLGLGSAAEADTGAGSGNVPVLDGNGLAAALALAKTLPRVEVTDDVTIGAAHRGRMVVLTTADGSADKDANLPEAASSAGFIVGVLNEDADDAFIIDPNASETVDGAATISLAQNEWRILWCDGTGWVSIAASVPPQAEAEAGTATLPRMWTAQRIAQAIAALASGGAVFDE